MYFSALEFDDAVFEGEEGMIGAHADVEPWGMWGSALAEYDGTGGNSLSAVGFNAEVLWEAIAAVASAALSFFMCHTSPLESR